MMASVSAFVCICTSLIWPFCMNELQWPEPVDMYLECDQHARTPHLYVPRGVYTCTHKIHSSFFFLFLALVYIATDRVMRNMKK